MLRFTLILLSAGALALGGCSDDDEDGSSGGSGGVGGSGATGGSSGSGGGAGSGGTGASGGSSGAGGGSAGSGGAAGSAGASGSAGSAGSAGGSSFAQIVDCTGQTIAEGIDMTNAMTFDPANVTISVGEIVEFANTGAIPHTATSTAAIGGPSPTPDGKFDTGLVSAGTSKCVRFDVAGSYPYFCTVHPTMQGTLTVQ